MLNTTKTWQERFDEEFPNERGIFENNDPYNYRRKSIKQFISDLRKQDEAELIKRFNFTHDSFASEREEIIRDYYEN